jgi:hypothetical protein
MLAAHIENLLFLLLVAFAGLFQLLGRAARKTREDREEPAPKPAAKSLTPIPRAPAESNEERIRKLLEALGQPPASKLPVPVTPRTDIPPRPLGPVKPPMTYPLPQWKKLTPEEQRKGPYIRKKSPLPSSGSVTPAEQISAPATTAASAFEVHEEPLAIEPQPIIKTRLQAYAASKASGVAKTEDLKADVATLLASKSGLRGAIILREIFGPPRGLQALEIGI